MRRDRGGGVETSNENVLVPNNVNIRLDIDINSEDTKLLSNQRILTYGNLSLTFNTNTFIISHLLVHQTNLNISSFLLGFSGLDTVSFRF